MLAGEPPFHTGDVTYHILHEAPPPLVGADAELHAIVLRLLAKAPEERFASSSALREELGRTAAGGQGTPPRG